MDDGARPAGRRDPGQQAPRRHMPECGGKDGICGHSPLPHNSPVRHDTPRGAGRPDTGQVHGQPGRTGKQRPWDGMQAIHQIEHPRHQPHEKRDPFRPDQARMRGRAS